MRSSRKAAWMCGIRSLSEKEEESQVRSEKEMLELIRNTALEDDRIRAAWLEGSRANPNVPRDIFQDYDVVYIVEETRSFREDKQWIDRFGERLYMQYPEDNVNYPSDPEHCYGWLMQFADGNRLDLHVYTWDYARKEMELFIALVDKDGRLPARENRSDEIYWVRRPVQEQFSCTCNDFWWGLNNIAKGLWRKELPYVCDMLDFHLRPLLRQLLEWKIGSEHNFSVSTGKCGKYMNRYLLPEVYERYLSTYSSANVPELWRAVWEMCRLFEETALEVSGRLCFAYQEQEAENSRKFLKRVQELPEDAAEI